MCDHFTVIIPPTIETSRKPNGDIALRSRPFSGDLLPESFQRYGMRTFIEALMLAYDVPKEDRVRSELGKFPNQIDLTFGSHRWGSCPLNGHPTRQAPSGFVYPWCTPKND